MASLSQLHAHCSQAASTPRAPPQFRRSIEGLQDEWQGWTYDLLSRNCNHFCEALVEILGVGPLPGACVSVPLSDARHRRADACAPCAPTCSCVQPG